MDIEEIRRRKLEELRKKQMEREGSANSQQEGKSANEKLLSIARAVCSEKAYDRLTNIMHVNPERFQRALEFCIANHRRTGAKTSDELLVRFLTTLARMSEKKTKIEFKRK